MNNNLLLYGSFARGDFQLNSDIDLLIIVGTHSHKIVYNKLNISYYNLKKITEMSESGSLFLFHLNREAKIIIDEDKILSDILYNKFKLKSNYIEEITFAKALINDIYGKYDDVDNYLFANSKISWCLRTIYSGIGADQNLALFSYKSIVEYFGKEAGKYLKIKILQNYQKNLIHKLIEYTDKLLDIPLSSDQVFRPDLQKYRTDVNKNLFNSKMEDIDGY